MEENKEIPQRKELSTTKVLIQFTVPKVVFVIQVIFLLSMLFTMWFTSKETFILLLVVAETFGLCIIGYFFMRVEARIRKIHMPSMAEIRKANKVNKKG